MKTFSTEAQSFIFKLTRFHLHFFQIPEQDRQGDLENMDQGEWFWQQTIFFWNCVRNRESEVYQKQEYRYSAFVARILSFQHFTSD